MKPAGALLLLITVLAALLAPAIAPHRGDQQFLTLMKAPPTRLHFGGEAAGGGWLAPFIHPWLLINQIEQRFDEDRSREVPIRWFEDGHLMQSADDERAPLLLLGADGFGRDVFSRLLYGARTSLTLSLAAAMAAVCLGGLIGGLAGFAGGRLDEGLMRASEFVIVLPTIYVVLALRAVLPLVLSPSAVFTLLAGIFAMVGAPFIARGVRAIVRSERGLDYAVAAASLGASWPRLLFRHLLPAARGFILTQATILLPSFIVAEATLSYVGLGFPDSVASWGTMLHEAANIRTFSDFPWLLSPAAAIFLVVLGLNLLVEGGRRSPEFLWSARAGARPSPATRGQGVARHDGVTLPD